jgi:hypothetical protein
MLRINGGGFALIALTVFAAVIGYGSDSQAAGAPAPPLGYYACGSRFGMHPNFSPTLLAGSRYRVTYNIGGKISDSTGSYSYDPWSKLVSFKGGEFNGLTALFNG